MKYSVQKEIEISLGVLSLKGDFQLPENADGIIVFAHGSGSSRHSSRNKIVSKVLHRSGFATLLFDLLTELEDQEYSKRFDIPLLSERMIQVTRWLRLQDEVGALPIGYFGASTGAAAALEAAASLGDIIGAVVSRGGRPDLAANALPGVKAPTLLIVGGFDEEVIRFNEHAMSLLNAEKELLVIPGASHLFEEPGKLQEVADHASQWFTSHLKNVLA